MTPLDLEQALARRIRTLIRLVALLATMALGTSFQFWGVSDDQLSSRIWNWTQRGWLLVSLLPLIWVYAAPRRHPVLVAGGWFAMTFLVLKLVTNTSEGNVGDWIMMALHTTIVISVAAIVIVVLPVIRLTNPEPDEPVPTAQLRGG